MKQCHCSSLVIHVVSFGGSRVLHLVLFCHTFNSALFENRVDEGDLTGDGITCILQKLIFDDMSRCCPLIGVFNGLGSPMNVLIGLLSVLVNCFTNHSLIASAFPLICPNKFI